MAKTSSVEKNEHRRRLARKFGGKRSRLKAIVMNKELPIEERFEATMKLARLPRNSAKNRIKNRCEISGRPRAYYRKLRMSRVALRDLASQGLIPGMTKSSW
jgi:small subunit ribosomal protein S14